MRNSLKNKKVLVTSGPTWIPIDDTRIIANNSAGKLGKSIATDLSKQGAKVTIIEGPVKYVVKSRAVKVIKFAFYSEFYRLIKKELKKKYDVVIHAAAVSDYQLKAPSKLKLSSNLKTLTLDLVPTKKIIDVIKKINPSVFLVGFKLESKMTEALAKKKASGLIQKSKCDLVVANSTNNGTYAGYILDKNCTMLAHRKTRESLSRALVRILKEQL